MSITLQDFGKVNLGITPSITAASNCSPGDLIITGFFLYSDTTFSTPTINDNVNNNNYTVFNGRFQATGNGWGDNAFVAQAYVVCDCGKNGGNPAIPTITTATNAGYSGGELNFMRYNGFPGTVTLDATASSIAFGTSTTPSNSITPNNNNSLLIGQYWAPVGLTGPGGSWVNSGVGGVSYIGSPYYQVLATPAATVFSGTLSIADAWDIALCAFYGTAILMGQACL